MLGLVTPASRSRSCWRRAYSAAAKAASSVSDPLRVLFCGSDEFSCASLAALHDEHQQNRALIESIDVVVRPGKPMGRGYKTIRDRERHTLFFHPPLL